MDPRLQQIIDECRRQEESCLYTSTALYEWLKSIRFWRIVFIVVPIIAGSFASASILRKNPDLEWASAAAALIAGLFPAIFKALHLDGSIKVISDNAAQFKVLQDRFRQAALIGATTPINELENEFKTLMARMDKARAASLTPPERFFKSAQNKIKNGDYSFGSDSSDQAKP
jgi:hypothetical protein